MNRDPCAWANSHMGFRCASVDAGSATAPLTPALAADVQWLEDVVIEDLWTR